MCIWCCVSKWMCFLMVANATKPHPIFPQGVLQQLFWLDHNFKIKLPDTTKRPKIPLKSKYCSFSAILTFLWLQILFTTVQYCT